MTDRTTDTGGAAETAARLDLVSAVDVVRGRLAATRLPLEVAGVEAARRRRRELLDQIDDYLLPRLRTDGAPLLVVVGGSTGAGKSTLVNSLLGERLTQPGVLRPTTRSPVLVHHPADGPWFAPERVFPTLARVETTGGGAPAAVATTTPGPPGAVADATGVGAVPTPPGAVPASPGAVGAPAHLAGVPAGRAAADRDGTPIDGVRALRLVPYPALPPGLALLDAPDIDSVEAANRDLAAQLLAAADLWLFVTTAARYADAVPWELLRSAAARHAQVALVISRVDPGSGEVVADLARMARENGLGDARLFVVPEARLDADGLLPEAAVAQIAGWLTDLGGSASARDEVALATRDGVVTDVAGAVDVIATAADAQAESAARLTDIVEVAYAQAAATVRTATTDGAMLRGEVLGRWQDFVGASDIMRTLERGVGRVRDAVGAFFRGGRPSAQPVELAIAHGLEAVTLDAVETARERVRSAWRSDPAGAALLRDGDGATAGVTGVGTAELRASIAEQIRGWQEDVLAVVREQGEDRRGLARAMSFGVNGLGVALMLVVFAGTGGVTGVEVGIAGGTAILAQKVLEAAFGDDAVRRLTDEVAARLQVRLDSVLDADATIALTAVAASGVSDGDGQLLRSASAGLTAAAARERAVRAAIVERVPVAVPALRGARLRDRAGTWDDAEATGADPGPAADAAGQGASAETRGWWRRLFGSGR
ncbi:dynamin family protein [Salana multivorans]|uniref:Dynamin family protein n=1 Tax=Salana multivorans TaxID=120377 RepID=A0A3N2DDH1_9MICO|nr:GTPase domain-containing protein [Salana multivorans]ROR97708.1 dynamin family protein [Salana multivorans]